jgi:hypothetical protein
VQGRLKWLAVVLVLIGVLALAGWVFPEFGTMLAAAGSVAVIGFILWAWVVGS